MSSMKSFRQIPPRDCETLKEACHRAVERAGGVRRVADALALPASRVSEAASPFHLDRWFSLLHAAELDALTSEPVVARALAGLSGCDAVPREPVNRATPHRLLARIVRETGDVSAALAAALSDGSIAIAERNMLLAEIDEAVAALADLRASLTPVRRVS